MAPAGVVAVQLEPSLAQVTLVAALLPMEMPVAPGISPLPLMVTLVPPALVPEAGEILVIVTGQVPLQ
jgi:hypothetical protein